ncbi:MAG: hypothetical protein ACRD2L_25055, partial [Terriglobia bacterium]
FEVSPAFGRLKHLSVRKEAPQNVWDLIVRKEIVCQEQWAFHFSGLQKHCVCSRARTYYEFTTRASSLKALGASPVSPRISGCEKGFGVSLPQENLVPLEDND